jgi:multiple sugar transport system substrate-binding protein
LLAIPANLPPGRARNAYRVLSWLSSPDAIRGRARDGLPISPLFSVTRDPEVAALSPIYTLIETMRQKNKLHFWHRPPLPDYARFEQVLGEEIHDALSGVKTHAAALRSAGTRIKSLQAYEAM